MLKKTKTIEPVKFKSKVKKFQTLKGFKDILPDNQKYWSFIFEKTKEISDDYSFQRIDTPILESLNLFKRSIGETSDIVSKEMFEFEDKGDEKVVLRPEFTASIVRSYIQHGMFTWPQPVKLWTSGPLFRYDKPQAGRYRQFNQINFEVFGSSKPELDSQLIIMAYEIYKSFGLDIIIQVNSIGCPECRKDYLKELKKFLKDKKLCSGCQERLENNPLRVLDCKEKKCQDILQEVPPILDSLDEDCKSHFVKVLEGLDDAEVPYNLNPLLVRGLDYYNRTTFEIYLADEEIASQNALGGGGRYDYLVEQLGGRPTPAIGFASGIERIILKMQEKNIEIKDSSHCDVFMSALGADAVKKARKLFSQLRKEKIKVKEAFGKKGLAEQMEEANRIHSKYVLILGQKEIIDETIIIRDMGSGVQEVVKFEKIISETKKRILEQGGVRVYNNGEEKEEGKK